MAENIYIDFTEEFEEDTVQMYQELCESLTETLKNMCSDMEEICNETQYEPIVNVVTQTIDLFNSEIHGISTNAFEEWSQGGGSFNAIAEKSQVGDMGIETARNIEQRIRDIFEEFWSSSPMGEAITVDTSRPKVKSEDFDELKEVYTKYCSSIGEIGEETLSKIAEKGDENPTYNIILPAVKCLSEPVKNAFEEFGTKIDEAKEESETIKTQQESDTEEALETATKVSASAADVAEALDMFKDI